MDGRADFELCEPVAVPESSAMGRRFSSTLCELVTCVDLNNDISRPLNGYLGSEFL